MSLFNQLSNRAAFTVCLCCLLPGTWASADEPIDFNRDVRPILSENCFVCHGFDESSREADLRLDSREGAIAGLAIVPGKPDESGLIERIISDDPDEQMPPADSHKKPLDEQAIKILREWIRQGAPWEKHWAFEPPVAAPILESSSHPIDFSSANDYKKRDAISHRPRRHTLWRVGCPLT